MTQAYASMISHRLMALAAVTMAPRRAWLIASNRVAHGQEGQV